MILARLFPRHFDPKPITFKEVLATIARLGRPVCAEEVMEAIRDHRGRSIFWRDWSSDCLLCVTRSLDIARHQRMLDLVEIEPCPELHTPRYGYRLRFDAQ